MTTFTESMSPVLEGGRSDNGLDANREDLEYSGPKPHPDDTRKRFRKVNWGCGLVSCGIVLLWFSELLGGFSIAIGVAMVGWWLVERRRMAPGDRPSFSHLVAWPYGEKIGFGVASLQLSLLLFTMSATAAYIGLVPLLGGTVLTIWGVRGRSQEKRRQSIEEFQSKMSDVRRAEAQTMPPVEPVISLESGEEICARFWTRLGNKGMLTSLRLTFERSDRSLLTIPLEKIQDVSIRREGPYKVLILAPTREDPGHGFGLSSHSEADRVYRALQLAMVGLRGESR